MDIEAPRLPTRCVAILLNANLVEIRGHMTQFRKFLYALTLVAGMISFLMCWFAFSHLRSSCTTLVVKAEQEIQKSNQELSTIRADDELAICQVYRRRVDVLKEAAPVMQQCGTAQLNTEADRSARVTELRFYEGLVAERCL